MRVVYLGPEKTFTHKAALHFYPGEELIPLPTNTHVVLEVDKGNYDRGVVPLENFHNGSVLETLDALTEAGNARIVRTNYLSIVHCLGALPEHERIRKIFSKDQAIMQCSRFLYGNFPDAVFEYVESTARAAEIILEKQLRDSAAIADKEALLKSGLEILAEDLCPSNRTHFGVVSNIQEERDYRQQCNTLFLVKSLKDEPNSLVRNCLNYFGAYRVNMGNLFSRPDGKGGYNFIIEINGHENDEAVRSAIELISNIENQKIKILGCYTDSMWKK